MAVALGDLLQITAFQEYLGQVCLNVFYFRWSSAPTVDNSYLEPLWNDFRDEVLDFMIPLQVEQVIHNNLQIKNLSNGVDFYEDDPNLTGSIEAPDTEILPSYFALGFKMIRDSLVTRNGSKRIVGVPEGNVSGNEYVGDPVAISDFENALVANLEVGLVTVAFPIIVKRPIPTPAGSDYVYSSVNGAQFQGVTTQNTRKQGRGI